VGALASALVLGPILLKLNSASTVYVPRISFEAPSGSPGTLPAAAVAGLPAYTDSVRPPVPGEYHLLNYQPGGALNVPSLDPGEYLVDGGGKVAYKVSRNFPESLKVPDPSQLGATEKLEGPQAKDDPASYRVWQKQEDANGPAARYLVNDQGTPVYLVDPGINGTHRVRPNGSTVNKFDAPKATLMSYIIKGILNHRLPWALVLLGVMISIVLEMSGISSLAFAVGVYLPLSSSSPIFIGGMVRWLVDLNLRKRLKGRNLTEEELVAEGDKSPGVLMASGYIAGGAIAGILIAFMAGVLTDFNQKITDLMTAKNPFFNGPSADLLSVLPFALLTLLLYLAGREAILANRTK